MRVFILSILLLLWCCHMTSAQDSSATNGSVKRNIANSIFFNATGVGIGYERALGNASSLLLEVGLQPKPGLFDNRPVLRFTPKLKLEYRFDYKILPHRSNEKKTLCSYKTITALVLSFPKNDVTKPVDRPLQEWIGNLNEHEYVVSVGFGWGRRTEWKSGIFFDRHIGLSAAMYRDTRTTLGIGIIPFPLIRLGLGWQYRKR